MSDTMTDTITHAGPTTTGGTASALLVRSHELASALASQAAGLLQAASSDDDVTARRHQKDLTDWLRLSLDPALEDALAAADRMIAAADPDAGVAITGQVVALRHAGAELAGATCGRDAAVGVIHLRLHLHHLLRVLEARAVSDLLTDLSGGRVELRPAC